MAFSSEQIQEIKKQLIEQINSTFPEDKKKESIEKINLMNDEQLIIFLRQNGMIKDSESEDSEQQNDESGQQCIFCSISSGQIPSTKIFENENSTAILELNPLTEGHTLIIPKNHSEKIPEETKQFSESIKQLLKAKLNPKEILYEEGNLFGHGIINLVPLYGDQIPKERRKATPEELKTLQQKILTNQDSENQKPEKESSLQEQNPKPELITEEDEIIPKRIP